MPTKLGRKGQNGSKLLKATQTLTESVDSRLNSSGIFSQDSIRCSSVKKSNVYCLFQMRHQKNPQEDFFVCRCSTTFFVQQETMRKNVWHILKSYLCMQRKFGTGRWSFIGPGSEKKWFFMKEDSPQGIWDSIAEKMLVEFAESGCPISVLRLHCLEVDSKAKAMENCRYTIVSIWKR